MGVKSLWKLLQEEGIIVKWSGCSSDDYPFITSEVDGKAVAVDLAMWVMQAGTQQALLPHFSQQESAIKIAFERALQWLRHGCVPVIVVEGRPPEEKRGAQQQRFVQRMGYAGGGTGRGGAQFTALGKLVASVLEAMGLPVFYAPGEAEAVCAVLAQAGCADGAATFDSDVLLYGAETVYQTLKLSTTRPRECEVARCSMSDVRARLGIAAGGPGALSVVAMLAGCDYDLDGAQGVGSVSGLAVARHLLQGDQDDSRLLERLTALLRRPPDAGLLALEKCTGCATCGHEGGRKGKIKRHTAQNPCPCCPPSQDGCCVPSQQRCACAFHALESERRVERIAERARRDPNFVQEVEASLAVFERQGREAAEYVVGRLQELGLPLGRRLGWLHRPNVSAVWGIISQRCPKLLWDLPTIRSKMLPALMEWDLAAPSTRQEVEWRAVEIQKVQGQVGKQGGQGGGGGSGELWRYILKWERTAHDLEGLGVLQVRPKRPRAKPGSGEGEGDDEDPPFSQSQQPSLMSQSQDGAYLSQQSWGLDLGTQPLPPASQDLPPEPMAVQQFDERWLKEQSAERRAVRQSVVRALCPGLVEAYEEKLAAAAAPKKSKASKGAGAKGEGAKSAAGTKAEGAKSGAGAKTGGKGRGGSKAASGDLVEMLSQVSAASPTAAAAAWKKGGLPPRRYGLSEPRPASAVAPRPTLLSDSDNLTAEAAAGARAMATGPRIPRADAGPSVAATRVGPGGGDGRDEGWRQQRGRAVDSLPSLDQLPSPSSMVALLQRVLGPSSAAPPPLALGRSSSQAAGAATGLEAGPRPELRSATAAATPATAAGSNTGRPRAAGCSIMAAVPSRQQQQQGAEKEQLGGGSWWEGEGLSEHESPSKRRKSPFRTSHSDRGSDGFEVPLSSPDSPGFPSGSQRPTAAAIAAAAAGASAGAGPPASRQLFGPSAPGGSPFSAAAASSQQQAQQRREQRADAATMVEAGCLEEGGQGAEAPMLQHWQQPALGGQRRARTQSRRGRGGGAHGALISKGGTQREAAGGGDGGGTQQQQEQKASKAAGRGRAALRAAAKDHSGDIRSFLSGGLRREVSSGRRPESQGPEDCRPGNSTGGSGSEGPPAQPCSSEGRAGAGGASQPTGAAAVPQQQGQGWAQGGGQGPWQGQQASSGCRGALLDAWASSSKVRGSNREGAESITPKVPGTGGEIEVIDLLTPPGPKIQPLPPPGPAAGPPSSQRAEQQLKAQGVQGEPKQQQDPGGGEVIDLTWD